MRLVLALPKPSERLIAEQTLVASGFSVASTSSVEHAFGLLDELCPNVVVLSDEYAFGLADDALKKLQRGPLFTHVPLALLSSDPAKAARVGATRRSLTCALNPVPVLRTPLHAGGIRTLLDLCQRTPALAA